LKNIRNGICENMVTNFSSEIRKILGSVT